MNKREAQRLARRIEREAPRCRVTGLRHYGGGRYSLDVADTIEGSPFEVSSVEDWEERQRAADESRWAQE
jgi:hypothetical protein